MEGMRKIKSKRNEQGSERKRAREKETRRRMKGRFQMDKQAGRVGRSQA